MNTQAWWILIGAIVATTSCRGAESSVVQRVRLPAVAGVFYPKDAGALATTIDDLLAKATPPALDGKLRAIIVPHAGYRYSGPVAAFGYQSLADRSYRTVILLAPSHYYPLEGASVSTNDTFRTPLGDVAISSRAGDLMARAPFLPEPHAAIERPGWWPESSRAPPQEGEDTPDTWEHSDEVQVPFLQRTLKHFELLPVIMGPTDPVAAADALEPFLDEETLIVVSSDLSHYHPYREAQKLDNECVSAICRLDLPAMKSAQACGIFPIMTLMRVAKTHGWKPVLLDCRNSGDTTGDSERGVVGYSAIAFVEADLPALTEDDKTRLLSLARTTLVTAVASGKMPTIDTNSFSTALMGPRGCFVTLTENGHLRGCIGHILPQMPLGSAVMENAVNAALGDPRFRPVEEKELAHVRIEVSVLTVPRPLDFSSPEDLLAKLRPREDGVVLTMGPRRATFLPQVWEEIPDREQFLAALSEKAGGTATDWRRPGTVVSIYHVEAFAEPAPAER